MQGEYTPVETAIIGIETGQVDLKTALGRAWVCQVFVPAVIRLLLLYSPAHGGLHAKIMRGNDNQVRPYLVYQVGKAGLARVGMRRVGAWRRMLDARGVEKIAQRVQQLEISKNVAEARGEGGRDPASHTRGAGVDPAG